MEFIKGDKEKAIRVLADRLVYELIHGKKVLWLLPGGSNITLALAVFNIIKEKTPNELANLSVTLTDERFGPVGHEDSNWQQYIVTGFDFSAVKASPVLKGLSLEETVAEYEREYKRLCADADIVIGHFGIGSDSHIAGALPGSPAVSSKKVAVAYEAPNFTRLTLTLFTIEKIDAAYAFAFGESKKLAIDGLRDAGQDINSRPAAILHKVEQAIIVSDLVESADILGLPI